MRCGATIWLRIQVLDIREKELGPDHVDVAASLNNIAVLLKTSGQFEEAEEMYNRSIAIKENALGPNHPQVWHYIATCACICQSVLNLHLLAHTD